MNKTFRFFVAVTIASFTLLSCGTKTPGAQIASVTPVGTKDSLEKSLRAANVQFYKALNAVFVGEMVQMDSIWSHGSDVTYLGPFGARLEGWDSVSAEFDREAGMKMGGKVACKDLLIRTGTDMGYVVCVEKGETIRADGKAIPLNHRATNIFRLENGKWKLVHHHTDLSSQPSKPKLQKPKPQKKSKKHEHH